MTNPVEAAVAPLKAQAMARAEQDAVKLVLRVWEDLANHGWDMNKAAPYPRGAHMNRVAFMLAQQKYSLYGALVETVSSRSPSDPHIVKSSERRERQYIEASIERAAGQYDAFVAKLVSKIGACDSAALEGSHVWGYSILTVTKGEAVERWQTQQIENVSVNGFRFPQWPSRKLKPGKVRS